MGLSRVHPRVRRASAEVRACHTAAVVSARLINRTWCRVLIWCRCCGGRACGVHPAAQQRFGFRPVWVVTRRAPDEDRFIRAAWWPVRTRRLPQLITHLRSSSLQVGPPATNVPAAGGGREG